MTEKQTILEEAISLLRDWEDYEPDDPECTWVERRDEFLKEHERRGSVCGHRFCTCEDLDDRIECTARRQAVKP